MVRKIPRYQDFVLPPLGRREADVLIFLQMFMVQFKTSRIRNLSDVFLGIVPLGSKPPRHFKGGCRHGLLGMELAKTPSKV